MCNIKKFKTYVLLMFFKEVIMFKHNVRLLYSVVLNVTNFYQIYKLFAHFEKHIVYKHVKKSSIY